MTEKNKPPRKMPKGGRKGGTTFPRISLKDAFEYAKLLVSKTHIGAQPTDIIYAGVVKAKSGIGNVRISALRQYGFLEGDHKTGFKATDLAKQVVHAPPEERKTLLANSCLLPKVFAELFAAFHGDTVTSGRLKQRAADLKVHPDQLADCTDCFIESVEFCGLGKVSGDQVTLFPKSPPVNAVAEEPTEESNDLFEDDHEPEKVANEPREDAEEKLPDQDAPPARSKPSVTVNIAIDSTMDTEKLAKQLELLKKYGAL